MTDPYTAKEGTRYAVSDKMDEFPVIVTPDPYKRMPDELKNAGIITQPEADEPAD
jgi:hypothetical protein